MFVDASAIVAILTGEPEADSLADALESARSAITSPIAIFEATMAICRKRHSSVAEAERDVREFLHTAQVECVEISSRDVETALDAAGRYGKGRGHPAQLNLGDCFAYAVARNFRAPLLFKGRDFSLTDIEPASAP
jgi:ribonuclease VapC